MVALALILMLSGIVSKVVEGYIKWKKKKILAACAKNENKILKNSLRQNQRRARRQLYIPHRNDQPSTSMTKSEYATFKTPSVLELQISNLE